MNPAPNVSILPGFANLDLGQSQTFSSSVSGGTSPYAYQWCLNGVAVSGATGASWDFSPSSLGSYSVYVEINDTTGITATSNTVVVRVNATPTVSIAAGSIVMNIGQSHLFTSSVSGGTSPYSYQWYLNGSAVLGATSATWTFTPSSAGSYNICVAINDTLGVVATSATSTATVLQTIPEFPTTIPLILVLFVVSALIMALAKGRITIRT